MLVKNLKNENIDVSKISDSRMLERIVQEQATTDLQEIIAYQKYLEEDNADRYDADLELDKYGQLE